MVIGKIYNADESLIYQTDVWNKFHNDTEMFEIYECPECKGHFLIESEVIGGIDVIYCPYCKNEFKKGD